MVLMIDFSTQLRWSIVLLQLFLLSGLRCTFLIADIVFYFLLTVSKGVLLFSDFCVGSGKFDLYNLASYLVVYFELVSICFYECQQKLASVITKFCAV